MGLRELYLQIMARKSAKMIEQDEFREKMRTGQTIDLREKDSYQAGHILGARNLSYSTFKQTYMGLRKDTPILLYDQKKSLSIRTANFLRKKGYKEIYILKGGFNDWTGKTKRK
ncbi:rhodanese-like domain-containing protein [Vagococcus elongatus]|uniref:Sulfurtransferase n=1 Tax=Vagococcus elongatus TaxID=180344 RepID=A0A430B4V8_9ENTE|nr:rhodanese-like domain-containing protein [Vagococcus elongatus]RSU15291.1 sulfurtransferase [Vagococcus elongatus]